MSNRTIARFYDKEEKLVGRIAELGGYYCTIHFTTNGGRSYTPTRQSFAAISDAEKSVKRMGYYLDPIKLYPR